MVLHAAVPGWLHTPVQLCSIQGPFPAAAQCLTALVVILAALGTGCCLLDKAQPPTGRRAGAQRAQQTETVQPGVPCSLRAKANAFSAGISRIFLTGLPRRPKNSTEQGAVPSFLTPG